MTENSPIKSPKKKLKFVSIVRRERLNKEYIFNLSGDIVPNQENWNIELKEEDINYDSFLDVIKENIFERNLLQKKLVSKFLENTNLYILIQSFNLEDETLEDLMIALSTYSKYEFFPKDDIIFKIGEHADKFYIILKGEVKTFKPKRTKLKMTKKEYILHLKLIKDSKDPYLLKKTILANKLNMDINEYEIPRLIDKINRTNIIRLDLEKRKFLMVRMENKYSKSFEDFIEEIDNGSIVSNCTIEDLKAKLYDHYGATESDKEEDSIIFDEKTYDVEIFIYEENEIFKVGAYFGENGNNIIDRKRTKYIAASLDTECISISNDIYQKNILAEFQKLKNKEISFLNDNCIFSNVKKGTFMNHYFKYFTIEEFYRGENIFLEMQKTEKIYFIKEGKIDINIFSNILKMHNYTNELMHINPEISNHFSDEISLPKLNFQPKNYIDILKKKKFVSLFLFQDNDMLGLEEAFYHFKRLYRATVISDKAYLYSIPINKFKKIVDFEPKIFDDYKNYSFMKICNLIKRLSNIKNDTLKFVDNNYKEDNTKQNNVKNDSNNNNIINCNVNNLAKKGSGDIYITNQLIAENLKRKDSTFPTAKLKLENSKKIVKKRVLKTVETIKDELERYYNDYQNWNKQLNRKMELMLNPQIDEFQFYNNFNFEFRAIKDLKSEIDKFKNNSVLNLLPKINHRKFPKNNSISKNVETISDNENYNNNNNNNNSKSPEKNENINSERDQVEIIENSVEEKNANNIVIDENSINKNNITIEINPNIYNTRFSMLNKNKKISQTNVFMTNILSKSEALPFLKDKSSTMEKNLIDNIESITYNNGSISSRNNFNEKDKEISKKNKSEKNIKNLSKEKTTMNTNNNTKIISVNNTADEEFLKNLGSDNGNKNRKFIKKIEEAKIENTEDNTEENIKDKKYENFQSTKLILSQSHNLKSNKLKRIKQEHIPRYYSNKYCNIFLDNSIDEQRYKTIIDEENSTKNIKKEFNSKNIINRSSSFVPFSVDNSIDAIKKFHKKNQLLAPKKRYNFIINNY